MGLIKKIIIFFLVFSYCIAYAETPIEWALMNWGEPFVIEQEEYNCENKIDILYCGKQSNINGVSFYLDGYYIQWGFTKNFFDNVYELFKEFPELIEISSIKIGSIVDGVILQLKLEELNE